MSPKDEPQDTAGNGPLLRLAPEDYPNMDALVTEDDTPVDAEQAEEVGEAAAEVQPDEEPAPAEESEQTEDNA